ncbi:serine protease [Kribbella antibiotica]|uniref:Serine protease n=1 Tax=Kribbella antibiotica TaxID=190195 RepID=A0A4R4ZT53_9ACTN|nr:serine protease [Kribbella antibiotica]TDD61995.1 serine protease [Kribbella antibiotica]
MNWTIRSVVLAAAVGLLATSPAYAMTGGTPARSADAPWMVGIANVGDTPFLQRYRCGGVLISPTRVLTAGHCLDYSAPGDVEFHIGGKVLQAKAFSTHPDYRMMSSTVDPNNPQAEVAVDDLTIVELAHPVAGVRPLPLARTALRPGTTLTVYGHGITAPPGPGTSYSELLLKASLKVQPASVCAAEDKSGAASDPSVLCAQAPGMNVCPGDSGGPVVASEYGRPVLAGLVSSGGEIVGKECVQGAINEFTNIPALRSFATQAHPVWAPRLQGLLKLAGTPVIGQTLTCAIPGWKNPKPVSAIDYHWVHRKTGSDDWYYEIDGARAASFTLTKAQAGEDVRCMVTAKNQGGHTEYLTDPVPIP